jgi:hypothetical protein
VASPEDIQQQLVGYSCRVVINLDRFGMIAEAAVCRRGFGAAAVADACSNNALYAPEPGVRSPESAKPEGGCLDVRGYYNIQER